nr:uncharacterized protein LOC109154171 [Ipomoea batatas]
MAEPERWCRRRRDQRGEAKAEAAIGEMGGSERRSTVMRARDDRQARHPPDSHVRPSAQTFTIFFHSLPFASRRVTVEDSRLCFIKWRQLWKLPVPPKVKNFLWRCMRSVLPVREVLKTRHVWAGGGCPFCAAESETMEHLFCACPQTKQVWDDSSILFEESLPLLLNKLFDDGCLNKAVHAAAILWIIWCTRNDVVWNEVSWSIIGMRRQVAGLREVWHAAYSQSAFVHATIPSPSNWSPPTVNLIKCNVDAAVNDNGASYGVVIQDHNGKAREAASQSQTQRPERRGEGGSGDWRDGRQRAEVHRHEGTRRPVVSGAVNLEEVHRRRKKMKKQAEEEHSQRLDKQAAEGVEGEYARVVEFIRKGGAIESHDVFVMEADILSIVKKDVKKEDDIDINAREEGNGNDNHTVIFQDIRPQHHFLGVVVVHTLDDLFLSLSQYVIDILDQFGMTGAGEVSTPIMSSSVDLCADTFSAFDGTMYRQAIGRLQYFVITRQGISFEVNHLAQFMVSPTEVHWQFVKRILRHVQSSEQIVDILTKPLGHRLFARFHNKIGLTDCVPILRGLVKT